jgi:hypothetical protein
VASMDMGSPGMRWLLIRSARFRGVGPSTPEILQYLFLTIAVLSIVAFFLSSAWIGRVRTATAEIGDGTKPAVVLAEKLSVTLADMNSQVTDSSLGNGQSWPRYLEDVDAAVAALQQADHVVDADAANSEHTVQSLLRSYYQLVGGSSITSPDIFVANPQLAMTTTLWASRLMRGDIISQAQKEAALATDKMGDAYGAFSRYSGASPAYSLLPLALLLILMVAAQVFLTRRTRRLINVPLLLATVAVGGFVGWFAYVLETGRNDVLTAKADAFDDLQTLYRAKVTAYLMKADESMWLFELRKARFEQGGLRAYYAGSFGDSARQLIDVAHVAEYPAAIVEDAAFADPIDHAALDGIRTSLATAVQFYDQGQAAQAAKAAPQIPGVLGTELQRFAVDGADWKSAADAVSYLLRYLDIDRQVRTIALTESRDKAVQLSFGNGEGGANWAFSRMDAALDRMIDAENATFDKRIAAASWKLSTLPPLLIIALVLAVLLSGLGLWQRYREYL